MREGVNVISLLPFPSFRVSSAKLNPTNRGMSGAGRNCQTGDAGCFCAKK